MQELKKESIQENLRGISATEESQLFNHLWTNEQILEQPLNNKRIQTQHKSQHKNASQRKEKEIKSRRKK